MSSLINGFISISLVITLIYFVGLLTFISDYEINKCDMTFMFEYPQFVRISNKIDEKYPKYGLFAYSEGRFTYRAREMKFTGIPVLFIPGNGGSHRQVRSLASVALRKALNGRYPYHFDYFCLNLNGELSGLNGALLNEQLEYANASLNRILDLYQGQKTPPTSVILLGHSMGGIIARQIVASLPTNSGLVPILLSLSSAYRRHPILFDSYSLDFYKTDRFSTNTTIVSVSGGYSDFVIPSYLTKAPQPRAINVISTNIPKSWLPADHLCILWCRQTILVLNRALFDAVDPKTKQISVDPSLRQRVFHHHLVKNSGMKAYLMDYGAVSANIKSSGQWIEFLERQWSVELNEVKEPLFYMVRLLPHVEHEVLTVVGVNIKVDEWVFVCGAHTPRNYQRICEEFTPLSHLSEIQASARHKRRTLTINMHDLLHKNPEFSHVIIRVLPTNEPVSLYVDVHGLESRKHQVVLPHFLSFKKQAIIEETFEKSLKLELEVPQLQHIIQFYYLSVDSIKCTVKETHATAALVAPWGHQSVHKHFFEGENRAFSVRLYESRPPGSNLSARIELVLDPKCHYRISIRASFLGMLSQLARFYSYLLVVNIAAVVLMTLNAQLRNIGQEQYCSLFFVAVKDGAKPYYILALVKVVSRFLSFKPLMNYLPAPDWLLMSNEATDFFLLPLLLYLCSVGLVWLLGIVLAVSLVVYETTVHKLALKFLARSVSFNVTFSDHLMSALHKIPFFVAAILVLLTFTTTGSLALCVGAVFYFMKLTQLSQDYIEGMVWHYVKLLGKRFKRKNQSNQIKDEKEPEKDKDGDANCINIHNAVFFHGTLFIIWCIVTIINVPSALTWAHNYKYSTVLKPDPAFYPGLILSLCALPLWQFEWPKMERKYYKELAKIVAGVAIISLIYAPISIYRLNYFLPFVMVMVSLHQLFGRNRVDLVVVDEVNDSGDGGYERIKRKLE